MRAFMRDQNLVTKGLLPILSGSAVFRCNGVHTWEVDVDVSNNMWERLGPGWGLHIIDDDGADIHGPASKMVIKRAGGNRSLALSGVSDETILNERITSPNPATALDNQSSTAYYVRTNVAAETVMRDLINLNAGPGALAARRARGLVVPASQGRGRAVSVNSRFRNLLEELVDLAALSGVNFAVDYGSRELSTRFFEGRDYGRAIRLTSTSKAPAVGDYEYSLEAPTVTDVLVAGQGQGTNRALKVWSGNSTEWGRRIERFQDRRDTTDAKELEQAGTNTLAEGQEKAATTIEVNDAPGKRFGRDFWLGDTVTASPESGVTVTDVVQSATVSWGPAGRSVTLQIGPVQDEKNAPSWLRPVKAAMKQIRDLQRI